MTQHADIHLVYPKLHRKVVLLELHIRDSLPEGDERDRAQEIFDRSWQAMLDGEASDEGYPDSETEPKRTFRDSEDPEVEIEERDHFVVTPEGQRIDSTVAARRRVPDGVAGTDISGAPGRPPTEQREAISDALAVVRQIEDTTEEDDLKQIAAIAIAALELLEARLPVGPTDELFQLARATIVSAADIADNLPGGGLVLAMVRSLKRVRDAVPGKPEAYR